MSTVMTVSMVMVVIVIMTMTMAMTMTRNARRFGYLDGASRLVVLLLLRPLPRFLLFRLRRVQVDPTKPGSLALMASDNQEGQHLP